MRLDGQILCISQTEIQPIPLVQISKTECCWMSEDETQLYLSLCWKQDHWQMRHAQYIHLDDQVLRWNTLYPIQMYDQHCFLYTESFAHENRRFYAYALTKKTITIGRKAADIEIHHPYISNAHAKIYRQDGQWYLEDLNSTNGCYVNNQRIQKQAIAIKDCIYIMGCELIMGASFIMIHYPHKPCDLRIRLPPYHPQSAESFCKQSSLRFSLMRKPYERFRFEPVELKDPPSQIQRERQPLIYMIGPSLTMCMATLSSTLIMIYHNPSSWIQSLPSIIMAVSIVAGSLLWPILTLRYEKRKEQKQEKKRKELYQNYLQQKQSEVTIQIQAAKAWLKQFNMPNPDQPLWLMELPIDRIFTIIGIGTYQLTQPFKENPKELSLSEDPLNQMKQDVMHTTYFISDSPVCMTYPQLHCIHVDGSVTDQIKYANHLILRHALLYPPNQLHIVLCVPESYRIHFPHFLRHQFDEEGYRFLAHQVESLPSLFMHLRRFVKPTLFISFQKECSDFICMYGHDLPAVLYAFHFHPTYEIVLHQESGVFHDKDTSIHFTWKSRSDEKALFEQLSNGQIQERDEQFPKCLSFMELYQVRNIHQLSIWERWNNHTSENSLHIPIGVRLDGGILELDLHEKAHGPHGIIAGMTGSGKSEFLIALLLSLAVSYHPYDCAYILIDYKGGGMAKALEHLPHCAGVITNLDGSLIQRSLNSLNSELIRRQQLFQDAMDRFALSSMDIDIYQRLFHAKKVQEPLPHLVIAADEFAELKQQEPQFMEQLIRIARIGRSLGVHLILATQKPNGVVDDQIWSNARFHICLKVSQKQDSMDMLKKEDGAKIKAVGRFFLQVGYDEIFSEGQSAYAKAPYDPQQMDAKTTMIWEILEDGSHGFQWQKDSDAKSKPTQLSILSEQICKAANRYHIQPIRLWQDILPEKIDAVHVPFGCIAMVDDPTHQRQFPLFMEDCLDHTLLLASDPNCSKEAMRTLIISISQIHTNIVLFDMDGSFMKDVNVLPHVYALLSSDQTDDLSYMMRKIEQEKQQSWILCIHQIAILLELFEDFQSWLLRCIRKHRIIVFISATSMDDVPFRLYQQFAQYFIFHLHDASQGHQLIQGNWSLPNFPMRAMWKGKEDAWEVQFVTYQNLPYSATRETKQMEILPDHVYVEDFHTRFITDHGWMIGISHQTRKPIYGEDHGTYMISGYEGYAFFQLLKEIFEQYHLPATFTIGLQEPLEENLNIVYLSVSELLMAATNECIISCKEEGRFLWCGNRWEDIRYVWNLQGNITMASKQDALIITQEVNLLRRIEKKNAHM